MDADPGASLRVELLGGVRAWRDGRELEVGARQRRAVLGVLAAHANQPVSRSDLIDAVWGDNSPASAGSAIYSYVAALRRVLTPGRPRRAPAGELSSSGSGYVLHLPAGQVDVEVFSQHLRQARRLSASGALTESIRLFDAALAMWHGTPWAEIPGPFAQVERAWLTEQYLTAVEDRAEILVALGNPGALVAELSHTARDNPFRERLVGLLVLALYRSGRQADALALYRETRRLLIAELGVEPCPDLQHLHKQMLTADPALTAPAGMATRWSGGVGQPRTMRPVPAELPHDVANFAGRQAELARLESLIVREDGDAVHKALVISAIDGIAGIGKTALAVHFAHRISGIFTDGQLFIDLRGFDPNQPPLHPGDALNHLLRSLGAEPADIPSALDERVGMYRSLLANRRILIVLDNAQAASQVRPLLPGTPTCAVIVTSRNRLDGLIARDGAHRVTVALLSPQDAVALLADVVGRERVATEAEDANRLVRSCGYLPLAIRIAAERIIIRPSCAIMEMAEELNHEQERLDALSVGDDQATAVRAAFRWSYRALAPDAASMFRKLGLLAGPEVSALAASALSGQAPAEARRLLHVLTKAHLLEQVDADRYRLHDLLRLYACECAVEEPPQARAQAIRRILTWYVHTAAAAGRVLMPQRRRVPVDPLEGECPAMSFGSHRQALQWCEAERANLVAAARQAAEIGEHRIAWQLPAVLWIFFNLERHWNDWLSTGRIGLAAARQVGDRHGESLILGNLGILHSDRREFTEAIDSFQQALSICKQLGDLHGEGMTMLGLGAASQRQQRYGEAIQHHRRALLICRKTGDRWGEIRALGSLGAIHCGLGQIERAIRDFRQAIAGCRQIGDRWFEATALRGLAGAYLEMGRFEDAIEQYRQAMVIRRQIGDMRGQARAHGDLANVYRNLRRFEDAVEHYQHAVAIRREIDDQQGQARTLDALGATLHSAGKLWAAAEAWQQSIALYRHLGDPRADELRAQLMHTKEPHMP